MRDLSFIKMFEIEHSIGPYKEEEVVLFNENHISGEQAMATIKMGWYDDNVLCIPKSQWRALFCNGVIGNPKCGTCMNGG